jgi:hypothetical protein
MLRCRPKHRNGDWGRLRRSNKGLNDDQPAHSQKLVHLPEIPPVLECSARSWTDVP